MRWKTVPQTSRRDRKRSVADDRVDSLVRRTTRDIDKAERNRCLASVSAGHRSL